MTEATPRVFVYFRRTRCTVKAFASEKRCLPGQTVPILTSAHPLYHEAQHVIAALMRYARSYGSAFMTMNKEQIFAEVAKSCGSRATYVPTSYTHSGAVFYHAHIEVK